MTDSATRASQGCQLDLFDAAAQHTTDAAYKWMREECPVYQLPGRNVFLITRYDDIVNAARDVETFSNEFTSPGVALGKGSAEIADELAAILGGGYTQVSTMLTRDHPAHTRFRRLTTRAFTPRRVASWGPEVERITTELIDGFIDTGSVEFVSQFAVPLPVRVIAHALGLPRGRENDVKEWTDHATASIGADPGDEARLAAARGLVAFQNYFAAELRARRDNPQDDFLTDLVNAEIPAGDDDVEDRRPLDTPEMLSVLHQLVVAGNETTTSLLGSAMVMLADKPDIRDAVAHDAAAARTVVDELLRLASPAQGMFRVARKTVTVAGTQIPQGATVILMYASGNRDPQRYDRPDEILLDRSERQHLAFGHGIHFCIGSHLSRMEAEVALTQLCRRIDRLWLIGEPQYKPSFVLSGPRLLNLGFTTHSPMKGLTP